MSERDLESVGDLVGGRFVRLPYAVAGGLLDPASVGYWQRAVVPPIERGGFRYEGVQADQRLVIVDDIGVDFDSSCMAGHGSGPVHRVPRVDDLRRYYSQSRGARERLAVSRRDLRSTYRSSWRSRLVLRLSPKSRRLRAVFRARLGTVVDPVRVRPRVKPPSR